MGGDGNLGPGTGHFHLERMVKLQVSFAVATRVLLTGDSVYFLGNLDGETT